MVFTHARFLNKENKKRVGSFKKYLSMMGRFLKVQNGHFSATRKGVDKANLREMANLRMNFKEPKRMLRTHK